MTLKQHITSMYSGCRCTDYNSDALTLQYDVKSERLSDFVLLKQEIESCATKFKSNAGASAKTIMGPLQMQGGDYRFVVTVSPEPIKGSYGPIIRPFTEYDFKRLATAMEQAGCITNAAHVGIMRKINDYHRQMRSYP